MTELLGIDPFAKTRAGLPLKKGHVYLVGAGPGDPDLITLKGAKCIALADVIFYDRLVNKELLGLARVDCKFTYVGKRKHLHAMPQEEIQRLLVEYAGRGHCVVRLKGGDPFIFGRGGEELQALTAAGVACSIVPGITAASGAAAAFGIPLTHRKQSQAVTFVTAHRQAGGLTVDWELVTRPNQTVVFYMGLSLLEEITMSLLSRGVDAATPFCIVADATGNNQRIVEASLGTIVNQAAKAVLTSPALLIMGASPIQMVLEDFDMALLSSKGSSKGSSKVSA
jgi:uroporphyrin-III C-methyltransferase